MARWLDDGTLAMVLAGGQGERLHPLTKHHAKPAVSFGGPFRMIDFTLANCIHSGLRRVYVLTQHKSLSLDRHLRVAWSILRPELGEYIQPVPPQQRLVSRWYAGTADAIFQNLHLLEEVRPRRILVASGDHVYRMDYRRLLAHHERHGADVSVLCTRVPVADASRMGVLALDPDGRRIVSFLEKPSRPPGLADRPDVALVNMGVYLFETELLVRALIADAKAERSSHDFGRDVLPRLVERATVVGFDVDRECPARERYWQDIGTLDSYHEASMDLLRPEPPVDLFDPDWPVRLGGGQVVPAVVRDAEGHDVRVRDVIVSSACAVTGAVVERSILGPGVRVDAGAVVESSVLLPGASVGAGAHVRRAIVDEHVAIPPGTRIGFDLAADRQCFTVTDGGVVVVSDPLVLPAP